MMNRVLARRWLVISLVLLAGGIITFVWYSVYANQEVSSRSAHHTLGATTVSKQNSSDTNIATLQARLIETFTHFDESLSKGDMDSAKSTLTTLQSYQHQILTLLPQLSSDQKASLALNCSKQASAFEADLHILPEQAQMDGMMVLAAYQVMVDAQ